MAPGYPSCLVVGLDEPASLDVDLVPESKGEVWLLGMASSEPEGDIQT